MLVPDRAEDSAAGSDEARRRERDCSYEVGESGQQSQRHDGAVADEHGGKRRMAHVDEIEGQGTNRDADGNDAAKERPPMRQRQQQLLTPLASFWPPTLVHDGIVAEPSQKIKASRTSG